MSHTHIVPEHAAIRNFLSEHRLPLYFSKPVMKHIESYMVASTAKGFRGKVVDVAEYSDRHRTSIGHFLVEGKWDESVLQNRIKAEALAQITEISKQTTEPLFVIHDDTIVEKTKPLVWTTMIISRIQELLNWR
ncbi:hypothetical protein [Paenibacillus sp. FSL H3-0457]|uniref:hypothetical protein n=1 Tax=Paenibacillus sp. FSL H3-0457 TaxID=2921430 RepID=UPI0030ECB98E